MGVLMELVKLKITGPVVTSQYGALSAGDILVTSSAFAKHLIEQHKVAEYIVPDEKKAPVEVKKPVRRTK
jgi:hypothetical protein